VILGSGQHSSLNSYSHTETLQINSAIGSFFGFSLDPGADRDSGILPRIPCLMILICVFPTVPMWLTLIVFSDQESLFCLLRFVPKYSRGLEALGFAPQKKGIRKFDLTARNNGAGQAVVWFACIASKATIWKLKDQSHPILPEDC
jgi:hypothetical protein